MTDRERAIRAMLDEFPNGDSDVYGGARIGFGRGESYAIERVKGLDWGRLATEAFGGYPEIDTPFYFRDLILKALDNDAR